MASGDSPARILERIRSSEMAIRIEAAREIRGLAKTSPENRRMLCGAVDALVTMIKSCDEEGAEVGMLALLNLAVRDERNKIRMINAGVLQPLIGFMQSENSYLRECATATLLTLTASSSIKPIIIDAGAIPLLINVLEDGTTQAKIDSVMALCNLSKHPNGIRVILSAQPVPPILKLLKKSRKSSSIAEKCTALLEALLDFEEVRNSLIDEEGGVLALVEVLEEGTLVSKDFAVGALLALCRSDTNKYREIILKEAPIPGLLELTVRGIPRSHPKAHLLLQLLRGSKNQRSELQAEAIGNLVSTIVSHIDGDEPTEKAKKMLAEMVQVSMEQSLRHLQQRAFGVPSAKAASL